MKMLGYIFCGCFIILSLKAASMERIGIAKAKHMAEDYVGAINNIDYRYNDEFLIINSYKKKYPFGWVFLATNRKFAETGDYKYQVPGIGPLIVNNNGEVRFLSSSAHPDIVINDYLKYWRPHKKH